MSAGKEFLSNSLKRMRYYKSLCENALDQLDEKDFHFQPSTESNSVAVMIQHIAGNMLSRFTNFLMEDGEKEWRNRDGEFEVHGYNRQQLLDIWSKGWKCYLDTMEALTEDDLMKTVYIRGEALSVTDALIRQLAHYPYHIGQIIYVARMIKNENWKNLSIPKGGSRAFNQSEGSKDPGRKY